MRRTALRALSLLLAVIGLGCATPLAHLADADLGGWRTLRSAQFELLGDVSRDELERFANDLATFVAVLDRIANASAAESRVPVRIYLIRGRVAELLIPDEFDGYMAPRLDGYYGVVRVVGHAPLDRETLLHEYAHFLLHKGRALRYPIWYDEGFAEVVSTTHTRGGLVSVGTPRTGRLRSLPAEGKIDLKAIFAPRRRSEIADPYKFYAMAWLATHYLATAPGGREAMQHFVQLEAGGMSWEDAYARSFAYPVEELSRRVAAHAQALARGALMTVAEFDERELEADRRWSLQQIPAAVVARALGQLGLELSDEREQRAAAIPAAFFARALEIDPEDARGRAGLAVAHARMGHLDEALREAAQAASAAPEDTEVQLARADVYRIHAVRTQQDDPETATRFRLAARRVYQLVRDARPLSPAAWAGLGWSYVATGDPRTGIRALERARELGAWDADVALDLGRLYRRSGDVRHARSLWMEVARIGEGDVVEQADALLALLDEGGVAQGGGD